MNDEQIMRRALRLAARGRGNTSPNPMVGAVIARDGQEIASGFHARAGEAHAELLALEAARERAAGATLYVTLEPCAHHGRTPPCVDAIAKSGVRRVVVATEDPDENVRGRGIEKLRAAGIAVDVGACASPARDLNRFYFHQRLTGRPFITLKMAQSLNGFVADRPGTRQQLTGVRAARYVRDLRYEHDAVLVGVGTIVVDDPQLMVRPPKRRNVPYRRVVADASGRIPLTSSVLREQSIAKTTIATTSAMPADTRRLLDEMDIEILECATDDRGLVDLVDLLARLGKQGTLSLLCEGGPTLAGSLLRARYVQQVHWLIAPLVIASATAVPVLADAPEVRMRLDGVRKLGEDDLIIASPEY